MSKMDDLIQKLCPKGVQVIKLGELEDQAFLKLGRGDVISKVDLANHQGNFPVYSSSAMNNGLFGNYGKWMFEDERITWSIDGGGRFFYRSPHKYSVTNVCGWLSVINKKVISTRYLYFALTNIWSTRIYNYTVKAHPSVIREDYLIPLPPLEIQNEIVKILDTFTQLEAELEAELEARTKQYQFIRAKLFSDPKYNFQSRRIEDFSKCFAGATPLTSREEYWTRGNIPWIASGEVNKGTIYYSDQTITELGFKNSSTKMVPSGSVLIALAGQGKTRGMVARTRIDACTNQSLCAIVTDSTVNSDYLYFYMRSQYLAYRAMSSGEGGRGGLNLQDIKSIKVPVPDLEIQQEIVGILEKYENMIIDLKSGLPAEIAARRQQYEYYRNKLLTFKELKAS
jgi:type I restriction enzyme S subunit